MMNYTSKIILLAWALLALLALSCTLDAEINEDEDASTPQPITEQLDAIEAQVVELRGLEAKQDTPRVTMTEKELRKRVMEDFEENNTEQEIHDTALTMAAFEFAEADLDLYQLYVELYTEQIAGFYDTEEDVIYIVSREEELGALDRSTFAHEYTHALQDQHFDLERFDGDEAGSELDSEAEWAALCLIEGDAVLSQGQHMLEYMRDDFKELLAESMDIESGVFDSAPTVLQKSLLFPYQEGNAFVEQLYDQGGWQAVNAAFDNPPVSTEQILHPELYPHDTPQVVSLPPLTDTLGSGWRQVDEDILGEYQLRLYLDIHIGWAAAEDAAEGWDGDRYAVYWNEDESQYVLVERVIWDSQAETNEFWDVYTLFARNRYGSDATQTEASRQWWLDGQDVLLLAQNQNAETLFIVAPDQATLQAVHTLFPDF